MTTIITKESLDQELAEKGYQILEKIGEGGSRIVFKAKRDLVADPVVVKVFKQDNVHERIVSKRESSSLEQMFSRELEVIRRFSHPNLVRCFNHGAVNGSYFLEEEYMEGGSLASHLGSLSEDQIQRLFVDVANGVGYLHSKGFYVRDFKLDNVLTDKELSIAKISDLELAGRIEASKGTLGSERYAAPELEQGRRSNPIKTDIFALGCGLYYLLTGQDVAFRGMNHLPETEYNSLLVDMMGIVDERYRATLIACLSFDPQERFDSALDLAEAIPDKNLIKKVVFAGKTGKTPPSTYIHRLNVLVRDLEEKDVIQIPEILGYCFQKHNIFKKPRALVIQYVRESNLSNGQKGGGWLTYERDGEIEGCMLLRPLDLDVAGTHMRVNYNHVGARRGFSDSSIISTLIEAADRKLGRYLQSRGIQTAKVRINLAPDELELIDPLKKAGFSPEGTLHDHYRLGENVEVYEKLVKNL